MAKDLNVFDKEYGLLINGAWTKPGVPPTFGMTVQVTSMRYYGAMPYAVRP